MTETEHDVFVMSVLNTREEDLL